MARDYTTNDPKGWCGDPKRGAALGRPTLGEQLAFSRDFCGRLFLRRVRLDSGGYDRLGCYFGIGRPLYWLADDDGQIDRMLRADSREDARQQALGMHPNAKIRR